MNSTASLLRMLFPFVSSTLFGIFLLAVAAALWSIQNNVKLSREYLQREGQMIAEGLANAVASDLIHRDYGELEKRLMQTASNNFVLSAMVTDLEGQVLSYVVGHREHEVAHPDFTLTQVIVPGRHESVLEVMDANALKIWYLVRIGTEIGWVRVEISTEYYSQIVETMRRETWILATIVALIGGVLLGMAILRSYRMLESREKNEYFTRRKLEDQAYYDTLTHLPNRALLYDRLKQAAAVHRRGGELLCVCFVDLDKFKPINDRYGHDMGDLVLIEVAKRLSLGVRSGDTVARLGGDEFVLLLNKISNEDEAQKSVERLLNLLNQPMSTDGKIIEIMGSIGYVLYPSDSADVQKLIELADQSMYRAKSNHGTQVWRYRASE